MQIDCKDAIILLKMSVFSAVLFGPFSADYALAPPRTLVPPGCEPLLLDTSHVLWSHESISVPAHPGQAVGLLVRDTFVMEKQCNCITVFIVVHNAPAYKAGLKGERREGAGCGVCCLDLVEGRMGIGDCLVL